MKILVVIDKYKHCSSSKENGQFVEFLLKKHSNKVLVENISVADGGEGTLGVIKQNNNYVAVIDYVPGFIDDNRIVEYLVDKKNESAFIEMALVSGIQLLEPHQYNPLSLNTYGLGVLIKKIIQRGFKKIVLAVGGSATNDAGTGLLEGLGFVFLKKEDKIHPSGGNLGEITDIIIPEEFKSPNSIKFVVLTDVDNYLTGEKGASRIFAPQKGANAEQVEILEFNMMIFADFIQKRFNKKINDFPGSGAAGGIAAGLLAFFNCSITSGSKYIANLLGLEKKISECDLVITGEGRTDVSTLYGKFPFIISQIAKQYNKKVVCISGSFDKEKINPSQYFDYYYNLESENASTEDSIKNYKIYMENCIIKLVNDLGL